MCGRRSFALFFVCVTCTLIGDTCQQALDCFNTDKPLECYRNSTGHVFKPAMDLVGLDRKDAEKIPDLHNSAVSSSRGMKKKMMKIIPYLIVPAFALAGIMPWILPPIKAAVMFVSMINNMAFSSALFMLIRNYIFNTEKDEHVIYINHGYKNKNKSKL